MTADRDGASDRRGPDRRIAPSGLEALAAQAEQLGRSSLALLRFDLECEFDRLRRRLYRSVLLALAGLLVVQLLVTLAIAITWNGAFRIPMLIALAMVAALALIAVLIAFRPRRVAEIPDVVRPVMTPTGTTR